MTTMTLKRVIAALFVGSIAGLTIAAQSRAGAEKVSFPENWADGVLYMTVDVPLRSTTSPTGQERIAEYREHYVTAGAMEALRKGAPVPSGTVVEIVRYRARLDAEGNPLKDANGRFLKGELYAFGVMEKRTGWGAEYPPEIRNGEWEYRAFTADKQPDEKVNLAACFECHKSHANNDYLQSFEKLKAAAMR